MAEAYIVAAARTAGGKKGGRLAGWHPADLAAQVLNALVDRTKVDPELVEDVIMGCVGQAGEQATNIARNAVLASKLPESVPATSVDRQCGSSQQALHFAAQAVMSGTMDVVIAAGVESMSRVPMGLPSTLPAKNGFGNYMSPEMQRRYPGVAVLVDAFVIAIFGVVGTAKGLAADLPSTSCVLLGVLTGIGGGLLRDIVVNEQPDLLRPGELQATAAAIGCSLFAFCIRVLDLPVWSGLGAMALIVALRLLSSRRGWETFAPRADLGGADPSGTGPDPDPGREAEA